MFWRIDSFIPDIPPQEPERKMKQEQDDIKRKEDEEKNKEQEMEADEDEDTDDDEEGDEDLDEEDETKEDKKDAFSEIEKDELWGGVARDFVSPSFRNSCPLCFRGIVAAVHPFPEIQTQPNLGVGGGKCSEGNVGSWC